MSATLDAFEAIRYLAEIAVRLDATEGILARIGQVQQARVRDRIERTKLSPEGEAWAPWSVQAQARREAKGNTAQGLLYDTGALLSSITAHVEGDTVMIGSDLDYAEELQDGTDRMQARPFLGWSQDDIEVTGAYMLAYIQGVQ